VEEKAETALLFRALGDPGRLRLWQALREEELLSGEAAEFLGTGPTTASGMLRALKEAGLIQARPEGRRVWYSAAGGPDWLDGAAGRLSEADQEQLQRLLRQRQEEEPDRYQPGRSWEALSRALLAVHDLGVVADLGVGTGELTLLLAGSAARLYAVDRSAAALAALLDRAGACRIIPVEADIGTFCLPEPADLIFCTQTLHHLQSPVAGLIAAFRALKPGGRLVVVEFAPHTQEHLRTEHAHRHLGVSEQDMARWADKAGLAVRSAKTFAAPGGEKGISVMVWSADSQKAAREGTDKRTAA